MNCRTGRFLPLVSTDPGFTAVTLTPTQMTVPAMAASPKLAIRADTKRLPADGTFRFARIVLTPDDAQLPPLHLTVAVAVPRR